MNRQPHLVFTRGGRRETRVRLSLEDIDWLFTPAGREAMREVIARHGARPWVSGQVALSDSVSREVAVELAADMYAVANRPEHVESMPEFPRPPRWSSP